MSKETFLQSIKAGGTRAIAFHVVKTYVIPFGMPIMTVLIGLVTSVQCFYIWIGFLASLAFVFLQRPRFPNIKSLISHE
jgi:hypothetical protein